MKKGETPKLTLRWHLARIYEDERFVPDADPTVHVIVHRSVAGMSKRMVGSTLPELRLETQEQLDRWDREASLEGWVKESTLVEVLSTRNAAELGRLHAEPDQRRLAEDMVLLQALGDQAAWREAVETYDEGAADFPSLEALARAKHSLWLDVTQPARRAARDRYRRALRDAPESAGGPYAQKR